MESRRPRLLISLLTVAAIAGIFAAVFSFVGYQTGALAKKDDVARTQALTAQLKRSTDSYEAQQKIHRERNEEAHSCLLANQVEILNLLALLLRRPDLVRKLVEPNIVGHPCAGLVVGIPPPGPPSTSTTSTTVRAKPTSTTRPRPKPTTTTAKPRPPSSPPTTSKPRPTTTTLIPPLP